ncbi:MBL fold metallo-hydrolase [Blastopirellula sp. JC732]|uniref:MBL fold metallo-hydrolase n=1 Tax=Blastopirellula sediminis TaxID=2894196 RepID=A0A9X1MSI8_9BACT|nr:MBL fold metallo-hydrolase [Blastopirellula sediminis]MCC9605872.1 MBL fold metallo-hydrolase [Blastopirellula sediminis]MCC9630829.1 MBL fold metallo-hydrolase [Blastopirellula sediminis]
MLPIRYACCLLLWLAFLSAHASAAEFHQPAKEALPDLYQYDSTCNVYVLKDGDAAILFNLGDGSVLDQLDKIGVKQVDWLLINNHHRENLQGIARLSKRETKIAAPAVEAEILAAPTEYRKWFPKLGDKYTVYGASYARPPREPIVVDRALEPGDLFEWHGYQLTCLATPGDAPGSMTYLLQKDGKTYAFSGGVMHDGAQVVHWYDSEWDYGFAIGIDALLASVDQLIGEKIDVAFPVQGPVIAGADQQLRDYREKLTRFRASYVRGYPVFNKDPLEHDAISEPTAVPQIRRVTPHLYKLSHDFMGRNFYIIISDNGHGLILDCGLFPKPVLEEMILGMRQHLGLKQIDAFWISHMHGDHFLLGPLLKEKYGAKAWTLDKIVDRCEHPRRYDYAALVSTYGDGFDGMKIDKGFKDGETVEWEGYTIHVDWMPGQTEFGNCLWLEIDGKRIAFTGDNLFGNPRDETQTAHDCFVCRNSAILEEGHILGSKYLLDLKPDIVMAAHSYVMPEPQAMLERYHNWSKEMAGLFREILPEKDYEYLFDPYWVSAYPYRVDLSQETEQEVTITVRNFRSMPQQHHIELRLPEGVTADPPILTGTVAAESREKYPVKLTIDRNKSAHGLQMVTFDIELDDKQYGELFDFVPLLPEK